MTTMPAAATTPPPGTPVLTAMGVAKRYSRRRPPALDGVDLEVRAGTITALSGPTAPASPR
ncbi:MAG: hypothetical protein U0838_05245 [Chloroflexota bacterium]